VPAVENVSDFEVLPPIVPVSNAPPFAVTVWLWTSAFDQVTVSPTATVTDWGENAKPAMSTA